MSRATEYKRKPTPQSIKDMVAKAKASSASSCISTSKDDLVRREMERIQAALDSVRAQKSALFVDEKDLIHKRLEKERLEKERAELEHGIQKARKTAEDLKKSVLASEEGTEKEFDKLFMDLYKAIIHKRRERDQLLTQVK